jgi:hypothetical protein
MQFGFGSGLLYTTRTDLGTTTPPQPTLRFGAFQDMQLDFSGETKQLFGQNQFALDVARGKVKIEAKAKFAQISAAMMNAIFFGGTINTGQTISVYADAQSIPATSVYTITITPPGSGTYLNDLGVYDATTGFQYTRVASGPTTTQYSEASGVYTFAAADASKAVLIDYQYTATSGFTMASGNPLMGNTPRFSVSFTQTYGGNNTTILMPNCVSSKMNMPTKIDDYVMEEFDFEAFAGAGSPITISTTL